MDAPLAAKSGLGIANLGAVMALALFLPAGTARWPAAWIFLAVFVGCSLLITVDFLRRDPSLIERRLTTRETRPLQKLLQALAGLSFLGLMVVPALDHRRGWSRAPLAALIAGDLLVAVGFFVVYRVYRANTFTAATIRVERAQTVVDTGPYAVVRHPMYAGALIMLGGIPLALGSLWGLLMLAPMLVVLVVRLLDEERALVAELPGYDDYRRRVRHRLIPGVF